MTIKIPLLDKNNIIENNILLDNNKIIIDKIDNYFENYINSDIKSSIIEYINKLIYFKNNFNNDIFEKINENLEIKIKDYLIQRRNSIRLLIKKNNYNFNNYNKFIDDFIIKITYIDDIFKINNESN